MNRTEALKVYRTDIDPDVFYAKITGREDWAEKLNEMIPQRMHDGMVRWLVFGIKPGGFLQAVLRNDLFEAVARADAVNRPAITNYVQFLYNYAPSGSRYLDSWKGAFPNEENPE